MKVNGELKKRKVVVMSCARYAYWDDKLLKDFDA
jgi:hypothetical protein